MKSYEDCKKEVAKKYGFGKLVIGHLVKYFDEAAELYADQFKNNLLTEDSELNRLYEWIMNEDRKPAQTFFTSGNLRNIAKEIEFRLSKK